MVLVEHYLIYFIALVFPFIVTSDFFRFYSCFIMNVLFDLKKEKHILKSNKDYSDTAEKYKKYPK